MSNTGLHLFKKIYSFSLLDNIFTPKKIRLQQERCVSLPVVRGICEMRYSYLVLCIHILFICIRYNSHNITYYNRGFYLKLKLIDFDYVAFYFIYLYQYKSVEFSYNTLKEMEPFTFIWSLLRLRNVCFHLTHPIDKSAKRSMKIISDPLQCYLWISTK